MENSQQFSLRWNNYLSHITNAFDSLRSDQDLVDVTLSCEGKRIRAHKMLLSACSTYFRDLFKENPCQHPVIIFRNVRFEDLAALIDFMYQGEVNVLQDQLTSFLTTAELLAVQGLASKTTTNEEEMRNEDLIETHSRDQNENKSSLDTTNILLNKNNENYLSQSKLERRYQKNEFCPPLKKKKWSSSLERNKISSSSNTTYDDENSQSIRKENEEINNKEKMTNHSSRSLIETQSIDASEIKKETPEYSSTQHSNDDMYDNTTFGEESDQNLHINDSECSNIDSKQEIPSSDELSSLSVADIEQFPGHILGKPSTSNEEGTIQVSVTEYLETCWEPEKESNPKDTKRASATLFSGNSRCVGPSLHKNNRGSERFHCHQCGKVFRHRDSLAHHKLTHQGQTTCPYCSKVFSRMYTMRIHVMKVHKIQMIDSAV